MDGLSEKGSGLYDWFSKQPLEVLPCLHKNFTEYHQTHPLCTPAASCFIFMSLSATKSKYHKTLHWIEKEHDVMTECCTKWLSHLCWHCTFVFLPFRWDYCRLLSNWTGQWLWRRLHQDHSCPVALWNVLHSEWKQDLDQVRTQGLIHNCDVPNVATRGQLHPI